MTTMTAEQAAQFKVDALNDGWEFTPDRDGIARALKRDGQRIELRRFTVPQEHYRAEHWSNNGTIYEGSLPALYRRPVIEELESRYLVFNPDTRRWNDNFAEGLTLEGNPYSEQGARLTKDSQLHATLYRGGDVVSVKVQSQWLDFTGDGRVKWVS